MASFNTTLRNANLNNVINALTNTSHLLVYNGTVPANGLIAPTGLLLANFTIAAGVGTISGGVLTFSAISNTTAVNTGTPTYYRMINGTVDDGAHTQIQGPAAIGGGEMSSTSSIANNSTVSVGSITMTEGDA